jgi:putative transcriptional regulator
MTKPTRSIAADILEGLNEAIDYLDGKPTGVRVTQIAVVPKVDVRAIRLATGLTQAEFAARYALPIDTLRKWERGEREPDAASRAYLTLIQRDPEMVARTLAA